MHKTFALAEVKAVEGKAPSGGFEAILSAPTLDRDGEVIDTGAFAPLPDSVPVHAFHDFADPIGRGVPTYEDGLLMLRGVFASTPRAQEIRTLVAEGVIASMSVGFMAAQRDVGEDGLTHVTKGEILEGSFVSIPSNREARVLAAKAYAASDAKATKSDRLQQIHDLSVANGAKCVHADDDGAKSVTGETGVASAPEAAKAASDAAAPALVDPAEAVAAAASARVGAARLRAHLMILEGD